ncbi:MAG: bifunctional phosphoglucose/phosphomannose isomerase [Candidatus Bathyarchaeota archaeon]|nr:bifunctional phosphoglucose/phosphomannose isomerase [Candidatus Bathyarchaeota archaeon]MCX8177720.1 bifunctional phosphoglucose/phosphomannose isomerase [Candidatus Bathyarchaeota archaeon]MDW8193981.1 bifunctional phosphoglucose/phosphomannose isomerase [Nitrososphaerota archaeon]
MHGEITLDRMDEIRRIDKNGMLSFCMDAPKHYEKAAKMAENIVIEYSKPKTIIVSGMGGSAIGGELLKDWAWSKLDVPIEVCRDYSLPAYVKKSTLVFIVSYSGETEETLSAFLEAIKRKCMIICISSGGILASFAEEMNLPIFKVPAGIPPRAALPYLFIPMLVFMEKLNLASNVEGEISEAAIIMRKLCAENSPETPSKENFSKELALCINGTVPVIYAFSFYRSVAQRFKQQFNENSKIPAKYEIFPELNHNEVAGWEGAGVISKYFSAVIIRDENEGGEIRSRIEATKEAVLKDLAGIYEIWSKGESRLAKMLSTLLIGDFVSVYLAILRGIDPAPVKTIELIKKNLADAGTKHRIVNKLKELANLH